MSSLRLSAIAIIAGFSLGTPLLAEARTKDLYSEQILRDAPVIRVFPGHSVSLSWIETGEVIQKAWLDDPSRLALSFDGAMCQGQTCGRDNGATVIQIKRIKPIRFDNILSSATGETMLTVIAEGNGKRKRYQFILVPASSGRPDITAYDIRSGAAPRPIAALPPLHKKTTTQPVVATQTVIKPVAPPPLFSLTTPAMLQDLEQNKLNPVRWTLNSLQPTPTLQCPPEKPAVAVSAAPAVKAASVPKTNVAITVGQQGDPVSEQASQPQSSPTPAATIPEPTVALRVLPKPLLKSHANALQMGLRIAIDPLVKHKPVSINYYSYEYDRVNSAIILLRYRRSLEQAARQSGLSLSRLKTLILMGGGQL